MRTALVLFEGEYSGALTPGVHYIALSQDYANIDEVFARLQDLDFLERMTERAYEDIVASGRYSYRSFVEGWTRISSNGGCAGRARIYAAPVLATDRHGAAHVIMPSGTSGWCLSTSILSGTLQREQLAGHMSTRHGELGANHACRTQRRPGAHIYAHSRGDMPGRLTVAALHWQGGYGIASRCRRPSVARSYVAYVPLKPA